MYSVVVPVFKNEASIPELLLALGGINAKLDGRLEVVFVVDGSPDRSMQLLESHLPDCSYASRLILLSRNFGSFAAIRTGLAEAQGPYFAVMAADLQEPPELLVEFFHALESEPIDIAVGARTGRNDPAMTRWASQLFWSLYRRFVQSEMPRGGVDVFGCNQAVRNRLLELDESNSSLVGLLFWLGFRRKLVPYQRQTRQHGRSAWTFGRKLRYLSDSVFAFSDLPVRFLIVAGGVGLIVSTVLGTIVFIARLQGLIAVSGYAAIVLIITFFAALNTLGLGIIGSYVWRAFENTKHRPGSIVLSRSQFEAKK